MRVGEASWLTCAWVDNEMGGRTTVPVGEQIEELAGGWESR